MRGAGKVSRVRQYTAHVRARMRARHGGLSVRDISVSQLSAHTSRHATPHTHTTQDTRLERRGMSTARCAIISLHTRTRSTLACLGWRPRAPRWALRGRSAGAGSRNFARNCTRLREHCKLRLRETWHENERIHEHARVTGRLGECERRLVADLVLHAARGGAGGELVGSICAWRRPREVSRARARQAVLASCPLRPSSGRSNRCSHKTRITYFYTFYIRMLMFPY